MALSKRKHFSENGGITKKNLMDLWGKISETVLSVPTGNWPECKQQGSMCLEWKGEL